MFYSIEVKLSLIATLMSDPQNVVLDFRDLCSLTTHLSMVSLCPWLSTRLFGVGCIHKFLTEHGLIRQNICEKRVTQTHG